MKIELIKELMITAVAASIFSTAIIQKIKENLVKKNTLFFTSLIISVITGFLFSISFTNLSIVNSIWVGLITWIGADVLYKTFEDKIFKSFSNINNIEIIERENDEY